MKTLIILLLVMTVFTTDAMDPEKDLCEELTIDAAVVADDNIGYAFKGNFFWKMSPTDGISQNVVAKYINERWNGLTGPIDSAFTIDESRFRLSTVFIKSNKWFLYNNKLLKANGTTDNWSYVFKRPMLSAFEYFKKDVLRKDLAVYLMYGFDDFSSYIFHDINNPTHVHNGKAYLKGRFLNFLFDPTDDQPGTLLSSHLKPLAVMSTEDGLVVYGDEALCLAKTADIPLCNKTNDITLLSNYYGCPRAAFPTTTTTTTTTTSTTTTTTEAPLIPIHSEPVPDPVTNEPTTQTPKEPTNPWTQYPLTTHPLTGRPSETTRPTEGHTEREIETISPTIETQKAENMSSNKGEDKKSNTLVYIGVIAVIVIICLVIVFVVIFSIMKIRGNKSKKSEKSLHKDVIVDNKSGNQSNKSVGSDGSVRSGSDKSLSLAESGLRSSSTVSVRSKLDASDESLGTHNKLKDPSDDELFGKIDTKTSSNIEADQILEAIKSNEDI